MPYADPERRAAVKRNYDRTRKPARRLETRSSRTFVNWDGEGYSAWVVDSNGICYGYRHFYILFGNSKPSYIYGPDLSTQRIFDFIFAEVARSAKDRPIHISFAFDYDVNMILGDIGERNLRKLRQAGHCYWRGYRIEHRPHKWFQLSRRTEDARSSIRIYDGFAFFACGFVEACDKYLGRSEKLDFVRSGKARRHGFAYADLQSIIEYWTVEGELAVQLYNKLRFSLSLAGLYISQWHGPGAIATALFRAHSIKNHMSREVPKDVQEAARIAYSSGRFEPFRGGFYPATKEEARGVFPARVWIADIRNAYPYAATNLPSLSNGTWYHVGAEDATREATKSHRLGLYRIELEGNGQDYTRSALLAMPMPLFYRNEANRISYPVRVSGWYHQPEAAAALFLYRDKCRIREAWIYDDDGSTPFSWLEEIFLERMRKAEDDPGRLALKLGPNSVYGKIAQRVGWNEETRTPPVYHQLEWAGAITSRCREMVLAAMVASNRQHGLVSCDTDGIISTSPFRSEDLPNGIGPGLGQWEIKEYSGILYIQNGVYWLRDLFGNWLPPKTRGIPRSQLEFSRGLAAYQSGNNLVASQRSFIGYGTALRGRLDKWRTWIDHPREFVFGGAGKRVHSPGLCVECTPRNRPEFLNSGEGLHNFILSNPGGGASYPHKLPWIDEIIDPDNPFEEKRWQILDEDIQN